MVKMKKAKNSRKLSCEFLLWERVLINEVSIAYRPVFAFAIIKQ